MTAFDAEGEEGRRASQAALLSRVADAARGVEHYRALAGKPASALKIDDFPITTKRDIAANPAAFTTSRWQPRSKASTGGTTGIPLQLSRSLTSVVFEQATIDHVVALAGVDFSTARIAVLRGDTIKAPDDIAPPFWRQPAPNRLLLSAHHLMASTFSAYAEALTAFRPDIIYCYPSALDHLMRLAHEAGVQIPVRLLVTSSEQVPGGLRARAQAITGAPLLDYYGQAERVAFAWSVADDRYFFRADYGLVELAPTDDDDYQLIATGLHNMLQPLIRYQTEDLIDLGPKEAITPQWIEQVCLGLQPFRGIGGRSNEYISTPEGRRIIGLNHIPRNVAGVQSIQLRQEALDFVRIIVVPAADANEDSYSMLRSNLALKLPASVRTEIETRDAPMRTASGKAPLYINAMARPNNV
jgi:phenylacetate-CoA ligase